MAQPALRGSQSSRGDDQGSRLAPSTFKRRFTSATGLAPIAYVQRLRIEGAKRRLERTNVSVDEIGWQVGYEDPAFFRRLAGFHVGVKNDRGIW
ncbi:MAG TPA: helix-turn-helix domain-containing protein [Vicinamibacterales bacterium]|nr:helix-turn-helix domain-containing protein [Vicinamibacterales bacterium]